MNKVDPDLTDDFSALVQDKYSTFKRQDIYIHWHESVSEYCIYIDDIWSGYVSEEYIFKAGLVHYKLWKESWASSEKLSVEIGVSNSYVRTCFEFCKEAGSTTLDYMLHVRFTVDCLRSSSLSYEIKDHTVTQLSEYLGRYNFVAGVEYLQEVKNELAEEKRKLLDYDRRRATRSSKKNGQ